MSRTDKTAPWWIRAEWYKPHHVCQQFHSLNYQRFIKECNLPAEPVRARRILSIWRQINQCCWVAIDGYYRPSPPRPFVVEHFTGPERARVRGQLNRAKQEWNGSGDTDVDPDTTQHRHGAIWLYW